MNAQILAMKNVSRETGNLIKSLENYSKIQN